MTDGIPGYDEFERDKARPLGHCLSCEYNGPMDKGLTGYECPMCHSMALELYLLGGRRYPQFRPAADEAAGETPHAK